MKFNINSNLNLKYSLITSAVLVFLFLSMGMFVYNYTKNELIDKNEEAMKMELKNLETLLEMQEKERRTSLENALNTAVYVLANAGAVEENDSAQHSITVINQETQETSEIVIDDLTVGGASLFQNYELVDKIKELTGCSSTIFQKTENGYVRISTSVNKTDGSRATGTYIPNSSPVVQAVEKGEIYKGRAFVVDDWYATMYKPILIDGAVKGMLYVGMKEKDFEFLKKNLSEKRFLTTGFPFIINTKGDVIIHPDSEGKNISNTNLGKTLITTKQGLYSGEWPEDNDESQDNTVFYSYFQPYEYIIAVSVFDNELYLKPLFRLKIIISISIIISLIIGLTGINFIVKNMTRPIKLVGNLLNDMAKGKNVEEVTINRTDEIGHMMKSLNVLIDGMKNYSLFAEQIGKGNFDASFELLSEEDVLGNSLLEMKQNLEQAAAEDEKRKWTSEGLAKFADILRSNKESVEELSYDVIVYLVKYLGANQGGVFILNDNDQDHHFLELISCYAFERKKYINKSVDLGEGLVGQAYLEKDIIYLTEIPQNYVKITSGLGGSNPSCILIVPLMVNDEVLGVIELASFKEFLPHQIEFVKKVSENIASTISSVKINENTKKLLQESQQMAEEMRAQEEEMRQNMEELQATQEEMNRREAENKKELEDFRKKLKTKEEEA